MTLEEFINIALDSKTDDKVFELEISIKSCDAIKKHTRLNIHSYRFLLEESYIRHVKNKHPKDLHFLNRLSEILNSFNSVEKSLTRNEITGQTDVNLVFKKIFDDGTVRMVAIKIIRGKILSLKTLFRPD